MTSAMSLYPRRSVRILLVEDDDGDAFLTERALRSSEVRFELTRVETGEEAIDFMEDVDSQWPDLILLDLNLPGIHGRDVLAHVKQDANMRRIPVVVLTSSRAENDILRSLNLHANTYMVKPGDPNIFDRMAVSLQGYWFEHAVLSSP